MNPSKKKILEKSFALFLTRSYDSVSMREIQDATRISRGAIYHHFKSKEEIYEQAVIEYLLPIFSSYTMIPEAERKTLQDTIYASDKYRQSHINSLKEITTSSLKLSDYNFLKFTFQATEHSKTFKEQASLMYEKEFNGWRNIIQTAMRTGEIRPDIDIEFVTQQFVISPYGLGLSTAFNTFVHTNVNDTRTIYLKLYGLLKKTGYL